MYSGNETAEFQKELQKNITYIIVHKKLIFHFSPFTGSTLSSPLTHALQMKEQ
jgi:hypothetical protein